MQVLDRKQYVQKLIELDRDGYAPRKDLFATLVGELDLPPTLAERLLEDYRDGFPGACCLFPDAAQTLAGLRASGLKLGLITNGSVRMQSRKLQCLALAPAFDAVLISDAEGIRKPDPRIFHRALERLDVRPVNAAFVGDNHDVDMAGARAAGMLAIWRRDSKFAGMVEVDAIIDEVGDLLPLLRLARTPVE